MDRKNETPEEKAARKAKHERLMKFISREYFDRGVGLAGDDLLTCIFCNAEFLNENDACNHYFEKHKGNRRPHKDGEVHYNEFKQRKTYNSGKDRNRFSNKRGFKEVS